MSLSTIPDLPFFNSLLGSHVYDSENFKLPKCRVNRNLF